MEILIEIIFTAKLRADETRQVLATINWLTDWLTNYMEHIPPW